MRTGDAPRFLRACEATVAIEFAFIAPVLIVLFLGTIELCNALICREKVTTMAASAADLVAMESTISATQINDVFYAINAIVYPYPAGGAQVVITSVKQNPNNGTQYIVDWSVAQNTTARTKNASITIPAGLVTSGASVILAEIRYTYTPPSNSVIHSAFTMSDSFYARPRKGNFVVCTSGCP